MPNIFRKRRYKNFESEMLLKFSIPPLVAGGFLTGYAAWRLLSDAPLSDSFGKGLAISIGLLLCGIGGLIHRWRMDRRQRREPESGGTPR